jgi:hypothetical protein
VEFLVDRLMGNVGCCVEDRERKGEMERSNVRIAAKDWTNRAQK